MSNAPNFTGGRIHLETIHFAKKLDIGKVKGTIGRLGAYLFKKWPVLVLVFICALITTIIAIVGTRLNGYVVDTYFRSENLRGLAIICCIMIAMFLVSTVLNYIQNILMINVAQRTSAGIRHDLFYRIQRLPLAYFDNHSSGDLLSRLTNDVDNINDALSQYVIQLFTSIITIAGMLFAMLMLSPLLTLICMVTIPLTFLSAKLFAGFSKKFFHLQQQYLGQMNGYIEEMISGEKIIKLFQREVKTVKEFDGLNDLLVSNSFRAQSIGSIIGPCNNMLNNFSYLLVAITGGILTIRGIGGITVGGVFSFLLYMRNFTNPINNILNLMSQLQLALVSSGRIFEVIDEPVEQDAKDSVPAGVIEGNITVRQVNFSYLHGKPILRDADFTAEPGQTIAIVGPTGSGKTTIINLLTKFYDIDSGEILIDGKSISLLTRDSLRQSISMVPQDTFLFSDTVRENIRYGRIEATDAEVEESAKQAFAHDFIEQLPHGYDTVLSENGLNLSRGQCQLLGIARAILSNASVLILDEATSSIDTRTEILIQNAMLKLMQGKTCFVIAHRLSTIRSADNIIVIREGHVAEQGKHEDLIASGGFYADLYSSQFKDGLAI